ncbi:MAG TPA: hypothetical protein VLW85_06470, partial [Myxococcales bacterium]|nr:hypothetical protein [Myxococcales bacterium]
LETAEVLALLGRAKLDAGHPDGLALVMEADTTAAAIAGESARRQFTAYHACEALLEAGRPADAAPHCRRTLAIALQEHAPEHPEVVDARRLLAEAELASGRVAQRGELEAGLSSLEKTGAWPREVLAARFALARVLARDKGAAARSRSLALAHGALDVAQRCPTRRRRVAAIEQFLSARAHRS